MPRARAIERKWGARKASRGRGGGRREKKKRREKRKKEVWPPVVS